MFAAGEGQFRERLGLIGFAVAHEVPHAALIGVHQTTVAQVAVEPRLADGGHRTEAHAHRGVLPVVRHQARVRVGGEAGGEGFTAEMLDAVVVKTAFHPRTGVQTGTGVTLPVHVITVTFAVLATEHVVQANLPEGGDACVRGDVAAEAFEVLVRARDHHHRVPPQGVADARLHLEVTGIGRLIPGRDGVEVRRLGQVTHVDTGFTGRRHGRIEDLMRAFCALALVDGKDGFGPFDDLFRVVGARGARCGGPSTRRFGRSGWGRACLGFRCWNRRSLSRGLGRCGCAAVAVSINLELGADFAHGQDVAHVTAEVCDGAGHRRRNFHGGLVGHHREQGLVLDDGVAHSDKPFDHFTLNDAFSDVGQTEGMEAHGGPSPHIGAVGPPSASL